MPEINWFWWVAGLVIGNITGIISGVIICRKAIDKILDQYDFKT